MAPRLHSCLVLLLLVPATIVHGACTYNYRCKNDCTGCDQYDKVADPLNCRGYYLCDASAQPYPAPFVCPNGEVYDAASHDCVTGDTCDPCPPECNYECSGSSTTAAYPLACDYYYECSSGAITGIVPCQGEGLFFDGSSCQTDETRCCHCRPYCSSTDVNKLIEDPRDCRKYYGCKAQGFTDIKGECSEGKYFDVAAQGCSATALCNTEDACRNVVGDDGCIEPLTCFAAGYFPKCPSLCKPQYYYCAAANGEFADARSCSGDSVFHPDSHTCVSQSQCP